MTVRCPQKFFTTTQKPKKANSTFYFQLWNLSTTSFRLRFSSLTKITKCAVCFTAKNVLHEGKDMTNRPWLMQPHAETCGQCCQDWTSSCLFLYSNHQTIKLTNRNISEGNPVVGEKNKQSNRWWEICYVLYNVWHECGEKPVEEKPARTKSRRCGFLSTTSKRTENKKDTVICRHMSFRPLGLNLNNPHTVSVFATILPSLNCRLHMSLKHPP